MEWVKGHYKGPENHIKYRLNKIAHRLAVDFLKRPHPILSSASSLEPPPSHRVSVFHNKVKVTSGLKGIINHAYYFPPLHEKLLKDNGWTSSTFDKVDWDIFGLAMSSIPRSQKVSICKLVNGLWNTNVQNNKYYGLSNNCPFCSSSEALTHIFTCPSIKATTHRQEALKELELNLTKIKTPTKILGALTSGTVRWVQITNNQLSTYTQDPQKGPCKGWIS
jgi:hypothetical protein